MIKIDITHDFKSFIFRADLEIPAKGVTSIFGQSGSGKTTLLNFLSGKMKPQQGYIAINDRILVDTERKIHLPPHKREIGYVFQESNLFPHYSVRGNLFYGSKTKNEAKLMEISELLDIVPLLDKRIAFLSGGEKQRIAIGRALLSEPSLLLMDEPLASLDQARKEEILGYLEKITQNTTIPILYVTHNREEARRLSTHFVAVNRGETALKPISELI